MKIHISFKFKNVSGGGNQFLKELKNFFNEKEIYEDDPQAADIILFNSYQYIKEVVKLKYRYQNKIFIHRIDGPIRLSNSLDDKRDTITNTANRYIADATIFQSEWSKEQNYKLGQKKNNFEIVILNAPNLKIFNPEQKIEFNNERKIKLISTSWSKNWNKGFEVYKWLDENLDFSLYDMTFVGNTPINFKNIKYIPPLESKKLSKQLKQHDIFITASKKDVCSNSLIEALHCGLPAIVYNDGGHPEIIGKGGEVFNYAEEIPNLLQKIITNYHNYQRKIDLPDIELIGMKYWEFIKNVYYQHLNKKYRPKQLNIFSLLKVLLTLFRQKFS